MLRLLTVPAAVLSMAALAGCGSTTIDRGKAEALARKVADGGRVKTRSVTCPGGLEAKKGASFKCDLVYSDGAKGTITLHETSDSGRVHTSGADVQVSGP